MSKRTHEKQLARARAKREQEYRLERRQRVIRVIVIVIVVAMIATVGGTLLAGDGEPDVAIDDPAGEQTDPAGEQTDDQAGDGGGTDQMPDRASLEPCDTTRPASADAEKPSYDAPPEMAIDPATTYTATIATTCGDFQVELFAADAPLAVNNFVFLAREDFYDGVPWHRTIWGFMIQGGDPTGTGTGGPGYQFADELDTVDTYGFDRGNLAMANSGPNTNGSQFFVVQGDASHLTSHTVFGRVTAGMRIVDRIAAMPAGANGQLQPDQMVWITDVQVT